MVVNLSIILIITCIYSTIQVTNPLRLPPNANTTNGGNMEQYFAKNPETKKEIYKFDWNIGKIDIIFILATVFFQKMV